MEKPLVQNAADEQQVESAAEKEKFSRRREIDDLRKVLATDFGRRFIWRYLEFAGVFKLSYTGEEASTCFNEGRRNVGIKLMTEVMDANPQAYGIMSQESKK